MATVEVSFSALPAHVRTARMIVIAVARRSGVEEALVDEVRLAVGEACSRAVEAHQRHCPTEPVRLLMGAADHRFEVTVVDTVPGDTAELPDVERSVVPEQTDGLWDRSPTDVDLGLAVIAGLADDVVITSSPKGVEIMMSWPAVRQVELPAL